MTVVERWRHGLPPCEHGFVRFAAIGLLASLAACFSKPPRPDGDPDATQPDGTQVSGWLDGFAFRKRVTVTAGSTETLVNFPVGVSITDEDLALHARSDGKDIVATAGDGETLLASELAAYADGNLELWVRLPELAETGELFLYYGGDSQLPTTATWDGPMFAGVWHLSDSGRARDSTALDHTLDAPGNENPASFADGMFGSARQLDGNDKLDGGDPIDGSLDFGDGSFSYSLWVFQTELGPGGFDTPFYKGGGSNQEPGYCLLLGSANWTVKLTDNANHSADPELGSALPFKDTWVHVAAVVDRTAGTVTAYANGVAKSAQSIATQQLGNVSTTHSILLGRGTEQPFKGQLDELRIYKTAVTPAWLATEVRNGTDPGFLTFGAEELAP
jgi:hypothetical protein